MSKYTELAARQREFGSPEDVVEAIVAKEAFYDNRVEWDAYTASKRGRDPRVEDMPQSCWVAIANALREIR